MSKLIGNWQFVSRENVEGGMKALGASDELIQKIAASKPSYSISKDGDTWNVKIEITENMTKEYSFKGGEEFDNNSLAGHPVKSTVTVDGDVLTEVQKLVDGDKECKIIRTADDNSLIGEMCVGDQKTTMTFKRV